MGIVELDDAVPFLEYQQPLLFGYAESFKIGHGIPFRCGELAPAG